MPTLPLSITAPRPDFQRGHTPPLLNPYINGSIAPQPQPGSEPMCLLTRSARMKNTQSTHLIGSGSCHCQCHCHCQSVDVSLDPRSTTAVSGDGHHHLELAVTVSSLQNAEGCICIYIYTYIQVVVPLCVTTDALAESTERKLPVRKDLFVWLFCVLATFNVISQWVLTWHSAHSWWLYT